MDKTTLRYQYLKELGKGATARVYLVYDEVLGRKVAVKKSRNKQLLMQEGRALASLSASFFPKLFDFKEDDEYGFLYMEYVEGETLADRAQRICCFTMQEAIHIAIQVAKALFAIHNHEVPYVFGDLKPENIMIQSTGDVRLVDFGAACSLHEKVTYRGGTKAYAPPELWNGKPDIRNDVYSFGVLLQFLMQHCEHNHRSYEDVIRILERCTHKDIKYRFQSMEAVISLLTKLQEQ